MRKKPSTSPARSSPIVSLPLYRCFLATALSIATSSEPVGHAPATRVSGLKRWSWGTAQPSQSCEEQPSGPAGFASSLCGACYDVCSVKIDIPVLLHLRAEVVRKAGSTPERAAMRGFARVFGNARLYERAQRLARLMQRPARLLPAPLATGAVLLPQGWSAAYLRRGEELVSASA